MRSVILALGILALYSKRDDVVLANSYNFNKIVIKTDHAAPEYIKAAAKLKGLAKLVAVDCDDNLNKELCSRYEIKGFPTLKLFSGGSKGMPTDFLGERTAKGIVGAVLPAISNKYVTKIGTKSKKSLSIEEFESNSLPRVILFTEKSATPPLFKALSISYRDRLFFGEIKKSQSDLVEKFKLEKFPTLLVISKDNSTGTDQIITYHGQMKRDPLKEFLDKYAIASEKPKVKDENSKTKSSGKEKTKKPEKEDKEPKKKETKAEQVCKPILMLVNEEIPTLETQQDLEQKCLEKRGVCIVSFIALEPEFEESVKQYNEALDILKQVAKKSWEKKRPFTFVIVNPLKHNQLIKDLDVSDSFPGIVAINTSKKVYRLFRSAFDFDSIDSFLGDLMNGVGRNAKLDIKPTLDKIEIKHEEL